MLMIKDGANVSGLRPEMILVCIIAQAIYLRHMTHCVITEGTGGTHGTGSLHYVGLGLDLRTRDFKTGVAEIVCQELKDALGSQYDVILESDHFHVEFQPK